MTTACSLEDQDAARQELGCWFAKKGIVARRELFINVAREARWRLSPAGPRCLRRGGEERTACGVRKFD